MIYNSVLLKPVIFLVRLIETSYDGSFTKKIADILSGFFRMLNTAYENSCTAKFAKYLTELLYSSSILGFFQKEGRLSVWWQASFLFWLMNTAIHQPEKVFGRIYQKLKPVLEESGIIRLMGFFLARTEYIIGGLIIITLITPHGRWNNVYIVLMALVLMFLVFINNVMHRSREFDFKVLDFSLVLFAITVVLSYVTSLNRSASFKYMLFYAGCFLFVFVIVSSVRNEKSLGVLIEMLLLGATITSLYGLWQIATDSIPFNPSLTSLEMNEGMPGRVYATLDNPNNFAEVLIMLLPFYAAIIMNAKSIVKKGIYFTFMLPVLAVLFYTGSRSGWIGFAVAIFVFTFFANKRLIPLVVVAGLMFVPFLPSHVIKRLQTILDAFQDSSVLYRIKILKTSFPMLRDYIITGTGLGTDVFRNVLVKYYQYTTVTAPHMHVLYLQMWVEIGIVGFISFVWFIVRTMKNSILNIYSTVSRPLKNVLTAGIASLAGVLVAGFVEYIWYYPRVMLIFWVVAGIVISASNIARKRGRKLSVKSPVTKKYN